MSQNNHILKSEFRDCGLWSGKGLRSVRCFLPHSNSLLTALLSGLNLGNLKLEEVQPWCRCPNMVLCSFMVKPEPTFNFDPVTRVTQHIEIFLKMSFEIEVCINGIFGLGV